MAIAAKTSVFQVRMHPKQLEMFRASCAARGIRPTVRIRELMNADVVIAEKQAANRAQWAAVLQKRADAALVSPVVEKPPVAALLQSGSLSERLKAEREAKKARKKKRENKGWE